MEKKILILSLLLITNVNAWSNSYNDDIFHTSNFNSFPVVLHGEYKIDINFNVMKVDMCVYDEYIGRVYCFVKTGYGTSGKIYDLDNFIGGFSTSNFDISYVPHNFIVGRDYLFIFENNRKVNYYLKNGDTCLHTDYLDINTSYCLSADTKIYCVEYPNRVKEYSYNFVVLDNKTYNLTTNPSEYRETLGLQFVNNKLFVCYNENPMEDAIGKCFIYDNDLSINTYNITMRGDLLKNVVQFGDYYYVISDNNWGGGEVTVQKFNMSFSEMTYGIYDNFVCAYWCYGVRNGYIYRLDSNFDVIDSAIVSYGIHQSESYLGGIFGDYYWMGDTIISCDFQSYTKMPYEILGCGAYERDSDNNFWLPCLVQDNNYQKYIITLYVNYQPTSTTITETTTTTEYTTTTFNYSTTTTITTTSIQPTSTTIDITTTSVTNTPTELLAKEFFNSIQDAKKETQAGSKLKDKTKSQIGKLEQKNELTELIELFFFILPLIIFIIFVCACFEVKSQLSHKQSFIKPRTEKARFSGTGVLKYLTNKKKKK